MIVFSKYFIKQNYTACSNKCNFFIAFGLLTLSHPLVSENAVRRVLMESDTSNLKNNKTISSLNETSRRNKSERKD